MNFAVRTQLSRVLLAAATASALVAPQSWAQAPTVGFAGQVGPGTNIKLNGKAEYYVAVYKYDDKKGPDCKSEGLPNVTPLPTTSGPTVKLGADTETIYLTDPVVSRDKLCLVMMKDEASAGAAVYSSTFAVVTGPAAPGVPEVKFTDTVTPSDSIYIQGKEGYLVSILYFSPGYKPLSKPTGTPPATQCTDGDALRKTKLLAIGKDDTTHFTVQLDSDGQQNVQLHDALQEGGQVCLAMQQTSTAKPTYSDFVTVQSPAAAPKISFVGDLIGGSSSFTLTGAEKASVAVYQFDSNYVTHGHADCTDDVLVAGHRLAIAQSGAGSTANYSATLSGTAPYTITLAEPLVAGAKLCLEQSLSSDSQGASKPAAAAGKPAPAKSATDSAAAAAPTVTHSAFRIVTDPNDNGRARFDFTAGSVITNQQSSAKSSTAATYLDFGFYFTLMRAGGTTLTRAPGATTPKKNYNAWKPGIEDFIDLRMTSVPVATKTTTTTVTTTTGSGSGSGAATTGTNPNVLTSQQAAVIFGGFDFPFRITRWDANNSAFYLAPVVRSGFATLLNPSVDSSSSTTDTTSSTLTTTTSGQFDSVYWHDAGGLRIGWAKYPPNTDKAPVPIAQFDILIGKYSNLPSIICEPGKNPVTVTTKPSNTTCYSTSSKTTNGTTTTTYTEDLSRTLIPRLQLAGFIKFPGYPFLMGVDANLAQYAFGKHKGAVDILNKPGDDVRIYFGVNLDPVSAIKKLGLVTP